MAPNYARDTVPTRSDQRADIPTREGSVGSELHDLVVQLKNTGELIQQIRDRLLPVLNICPRPTKGESTAASSPTQCKLAAEIGDARRYAGTIDSDLREILESVDL